MRTGRDSASRRIKRGSASRRHRVLCHRTYQSETEVFVGKIARQLQTKQTLFLCLDISCLNAAAPVSHITFSTSLCWVLIFMVRWSQSVS